MPPSSSPIGDRPIRRFLPPAIFLTAIIVAWIWRTPEPRVLSTFRGQTMGTTYTVKIISKVALNGEQNARVGLLINQTLDAVNQSMSTYIESSEISRLNRASAPFEGSAPLVDLIRDAHAISDATGGAFDVTVGPLVNAWGFGPDKHGTPPDPATIEALTQKIGYRKLTIEGRTITKTHPEMYVDLSAIAKGYGVDRVFEVLRDVGHADLLVEIGGETRAQGRNQHDAPWRIGIEKPVEGSREVLDAIPIDTMAMATSGDYRNFYEKDGKRISHTIDARTGQPITHRLASVSVLHPRCALADGWATALNVLGPEEGVRVAEEQGLAAYFIVREADGTPTIKKTAAMESLLRR